MVLVLVTEGTRTSLHLLIVISFNCILIMATRPDSVAVTSVRCADMYSVSWFIKLMSVQFISRNK